MSSTPMIYQVSWAHTIPQFLVLLALILIGAVAMPSGGLYLGVVVYFIARFLLRTIPSDHRAGVALTRQGRFDEAIPRFEESLQFFESRPWLDAYRSILLLSPSAISYREMAFANIGFCFSQLGDGENAQLWYERCLEEFPNSKIAATSLNMIRSGEVAR